MNRRRDTRVQPRIRQSSGVSNVSTPKLTDKTKASPSLKVQPTFSKKTFSGSQSGPSMRVGGTKDEAWYRSFILKQREKGPTEFKTRFFLFAAWDDVQEFSERRPVLGFIAKVLIVIAFIGVFVF